MFEPGGRVFVRQDELLFGSVGSLQQLDKGICECLDRAKISRAEKVLKKEVIKVLRGCCFRAYFACAIK
jgi:hypothetical protein